MIIAEFKDGYDYASAYGLWQWDYGQVLRIQGLDLPTAVEIHFSLTETGGEAVTRVGTTKDGVTDVVIPDSMLENSGITRNYYIYVFIYLTDETSGETVKKITLQVKARPKPEAFDAPGDDELFREAIAAVNECAERAEAAQSSAEQAAKEAQDSATQAETAKTAASESATAAQSAADRKEVAQLKTDTEQLKQSAENAAQSAASAAQQAGQSAGAASQSATQAGQYAQQASQAATQAGQSAGEAAQSATNAAQSVQDAEQAGTDSVAAIQAAEDEALAAIEDAGRDIAPGIVCEAEGELIQVTDSADRLVSDFKMTGVTEQASTTGAQLFDIASATIGAVSKVTGENLEYGANWMSSDYIQVVPEQQYSCTYAVNYQDTGYAFYDGKKTFLSGIPCTTNFTVPESAVFCRITVNTTDGDPNIFMLNAGSAALP